jgi:hypothetical protein
MKPRASKKKTAPRAEKALASIPLAGSHQLTVERSRAGNLLTLRGAKGQLCLSIEITEKGPILRFEGAALRLEVGGDLSISADRLALNARSELALTTQGELRITAQGDLVSEARIQTIKAQLGDVNIKANDDVRVNGERVMVNCVET